MGSRPITFPWLWPATDHEPYCRHVPSNKIWRRTESTPQSRWWRSPGIYSDWIYREIPLSKYQLLESPPQLAWQRTVGLEAWVEYDRRLDLATSTTMFRCPDSRLQLFHPEQFLVLAACRQHQRPTAGSHHETEWRRWWCHSVCLCNLHQPAANRRYVSDKVLYLWSVVIYRSRSRNQPVDHSYYYNYNHLTASFPGQPG